MPRARKTSAAKSGSSQRGTRTAVLLVDGIAWNDDDGLRHEFDGQSMDPPQASAKGAKVELPLAAFEHHKNGGNVAAPRSRDAKEAEADADATSEEPETT
jgi:hypothetical protein